MSSKNKNILIAVLSAVIILLFVIIGVLVSRGGDADKGASSSASSDIIDSGHFQDAEENITTASSAGKVTTAADVQTTEKIKVTTTTASDEKDTVTTTKKSKKNKKEYDIVIDGNAYRWNSTMDNWINKPYSVNEIGCIHTVQGYDLNYVGVIIGEDVKYDLAKKTIIADKANYYDTLGKSGIADDPDALKDYLENIYRTLMTRGVRGTYVYVCNKELRDYMSQFIDKK